MFSNGVFVLKNSILEKNPANKLKESNSIKNRNGVL